MTHLLPATVNMTREIQSHISETLVVYGSETHKHIGAFVNCYLNKNIGGDSLKSEPLPLPIYSTACGHRWWSGTIIILSLLHTTVYRASWLDQVPVTLKPLGFFHTCNSSFTFSTSVSNMREM